MKTLNILSILGVISVFMSMSGCVADREHTHGRYEDDRHDPNHAGAHEDERAERRDHDDRCAAREGTGPGNGCDNR